MTNSSAMLVNVGDLIKVGEDTSFVVSNTPSGSSQLITLGNGHVLILDALDEVVVVDSNLVMFL